jgi:hypothetical protein
LTAVDEARLIDELSAIPPLMAQAQRNLVGNARDLWVTGIRDVRSQIRKLDQVLEMAGPGASSALRDVIVESKSATEALVAYLEDESPSKTGPSGIGKDNYTWYQQNVHLVPLTWEDEVRLFAIATCHHWLPSTTLRITTRWHRMPLIESSISLSIRRFLRSLIT